MTPPTGTMFEELLDSDPMLEAVGERPSHDQLARDSNTLATVLDLKEGLGFHARTCETARVVKRWTKIACVGIGVVLALQLLIAGLGRSYLRDTVRTVLREEMSHTAKVDQPAWAPLIPSAFAKGPTP
jgi:hypothetical protein